MKADLVLEGGGVLGIAHAGAVTTLARRGYEFPRVAGTSAGAVVGSLVAAGIAADQIEATVRSLDYRRFRDREGIDRLPLIGRPLSLLLESGVYEGDYLREWLIAELRKLGVETFADLRVDDPEGTLPPERSYKLVVIVADVTRAELVRLPWDYARYGLDPDRQLVADAVRASASIPFFFEPAKLVDSTLVDGGVLSNFPIDVFDRTDGKPPRWPTFGIELVSSAEAARRGALTPRPVRLLRQLVHTMMVAHDRGHLAKPWVAARTIHVDTGSVPSVDFGIGEEEQRMLFEGGRQAAEGFLAGWDFDEYLERFRS